MDKAVNVLRGLSIDMINKANSGHPGLPLGAAPIVYTVYKDFMKFNPKEPRWIGRDRFVLSAGHGSALLYSVLYSFGYGLTMEDLKNFRQFGSKTPGHPEYGLTEGVETTTGPLGQGFANAVGFEIAREYMAKKFDKEDIKLFDNYTYVLLGDGCMMEGVVAEAASLAGKLKLSHLIAIYDDNNITIEGNTSLAFTEDVKKRFEAYGFEVIEVNDGNDREALKKAIEKAKQSDKPSLIKVKTVIGYGSPNMAGKAKVHGSPLGEEEAKLTKKNLGLPEDEKFYFPEDVKQHFQNIISEKIKEYEEWNEKFKLYKEKYPEDFQSLEKFLNEEYAKNCDYSVFNTDKSEMATREAIGISLNALADVIPNFMGGSADLAPSTKTYLNDYEDFDAGQPGRNLRFGIREHAMGAIVNGITLYLDGALRGYGSTFLVFSDYMKHTVRLSALMEIPSLFIFTHDSIGVGEDGPTHQPVEHVAALRGIPEHYVIRPADFYETAYFLLWFMKNKRSASFVLSRQKLPVLNGLKSDNVLKGGYVLEDAENYDVILVATGSEVSLALESKKVLEKEGIKARVVSMPCKELFEEQEETYKNEVINKEKPVLVIEAGVKHGWEGYYCNKGDIISVDKFGASAPYKVVFDKYGFNTENVVKKVKKLLNK